MLSDAAFVAISVASGLLIVVLLAYLLRSVVRLHHKGLPTRLVVAAVVVVAATDALVTIAIDNSSSWQRFVGGYVSTPLLILGGTWFVFRLWARGRL